MGQLQNIQNWVVQNILNNPPIFLLLLVLMWPVVGMVIGRMSNWPRLMADFPDRDEAPVSQFSGQSGFMNQVRMNRVLKLGVCPSGLRIGIMRLFMPFARDFFVPWQAIRAIRKKSWSGATVELQFGNPAIGSLALPERVAERLANAGARFVMPSS